MTDLSTEDLALAHLDLLPDLIAAVGDTENPEGLARVSAGEASTIVVTTIISSSGVHSIDITALCAGGNVDLGAVRISTLGRNEQ